MGCDAVQLPVTTYTACSASIMPRLVPLKYVSSIKKPSTVLGIRRQRTLAAYTASIVNRGTGKWVAALLNYDSDCFADVMHGC